MTGLPIRAPDPDPVWRARLDVLGEAFWEEFAKASTGCAYDIDVLNDEMLVEFCCAVLGAVGVGRRTGIAVEA